MARPVKFAGSGRASGVGAEKAPKPSSRRLGGTTCAGWSSALAAPAAVAVAVCVAVLEPASDTMRLSISTNEPDSGRSDQRVSAVTWNSTIMPLPRRCAVTSGVPSVSVAQVRSVSSASGSASTWRRTVTSLGTVMVANGLSCEKPARCCGLSQLKRAAEGAAAAAQAHRDEVVVLGAGEMRAGKAHQHAAVVDPFGQRLVRLADIADVGEDQHRQMLVEEARDRFRRRHRAGRAHVGEGIERAGEIVAGAEQRLRLVGVGAGDDADGAAAPALVEQLHRAGGTLADDFQPRHVVADLDRQVDRGLSPRARSP